MTTHLATTQHALPESCRRSPCSQEPPGIGAGRQQQKRLSWMKEPMSDSAPKASFSSCIVVFAQSDNTSSAGSTEAQGCKSCQQRCQGQKIRRRCAFAALHDLLYAKGSVRFVMAPAIRRIESQRIMQETLPTTARDTPKDEFIQGASWAPTPFQAPQVCGRLKPFGIALQMISC